MWKLNLYIGPIHDMHIHSKTTQHIHAEQWAARWSARGATWGVKRLAQGPKVVPLEGVGSSSFLAWSQAPGHSPFSDPWFRIIHNNYINILIWYCCNENEWFSFNSATSIMGRKNKTTTLYRGCFSGTEEASIHFESTYRNHRYRNYLKCNQWVVCNTKLGTYWLKNTINMLLR